MKFRTIAIFVVAQLAVACSEPKEIAAGNFLPALTLISGGSDTLQLDSRTRIAGSDIHFLREEDVDYLFLHAGFSFVSIDIYNFSERRFSKRINLSKEGPNGIGSPPSGLVVKSLDTLFLFFNLGQRLISIDGSGNVLENYGSIRSGFEHQKYPYIEVSAVQPAYYHRNTIRFCTYQAESMHEWGGGVFDLHSRDFQYFTHLPDIYRKGWWAGVVYDRYYHTLNRQKDIYVWSYGNDPFIYTISAEGFRKFPAGSKFLPEKLKPFKKAPGDFVTEENNLYRHAALQGGYSAIKYDPWQHVYYRFVIRPVSEHQYKKPTDTWNNIGIIILDEFFNYRGEFLIPDRFDWYQSFIGPKGIYFLDKSYLSKTEDKVVFTFFKVSPLHQK